MPATSYILNSFRYIGCGLLIVSPFLGWLDAPLSGWMKGGALVPFAPFPFESQPVRLLSFGAAAAVLGIAGALFPGRDRVRAAAGILGLSIGILFVYHLAFLAPDWFWPLLDENSQYERMYDFSISHLPINEGLEPTFEADLSAEDLEDRLTVSAHFLGLGWILEILGSGILIATTRPYRRAAMVPAVIFVLGLAPPWAANYYRDRGDKLLGQNLAEKALGNYMAAKRIDSYMEWNPEFVVKLGEAYTRLNRNDTAEAHVYQGDLLMQSDKTQEAAFEYERGMETGPERARRMAVEYLSGMYVTTGLTLFDGDEKQKSILYFQRALEADPVQIEAAYYMAKAYYDLGYYPEALQANERVLERVRNPIILANVNANLGDCYYKQGEFVLARHYYDRSMKLDTYDNMRALKSLVGP